MAFSSLCQAAGPLRASAFLARTLERAHHFFALEPLLTKVLAATAIRMEQGFYWLLPDEAGLLFDCLLGVDAGDEAPDRGTPPPSATPMTAPGPWRGARRPFRRFATRRLPKSH